MTVESVFKFIQGIIKIRGATDNTLIGNSSDRLRVESSFEDHLATSFGRLRVANSYTAFESTFNYDKQSLVWDESLVTGGTNTWNTNRNSLDLVTTTTSGSSAIVQSRRRIKYNPARSVIVQISSNLGGAKASCRRRLGQFDANNGVFFELDGVTLKTVIRSNVSGSIVNTSVDQSSWNGDKLDGTGPSGINLDLTKHQLWIIEYGWQGIATVRFGLYVNGKVIYCHTVYSSNISDNPYMKTANLPLRVENTNTATTASSTTLSVNCFCVKHEGGDEDREGLTRSFTRPSLKTVSALPTYTPVISLRLNSSRIDSIVDLVKTSVFAQTADNVIWKIVLNASLTGATYSDSIGYLNIDTAATAMSGGTDILSGIINQNQDSGIETSELLKQLNTLLGASISGTSDVITIAASSRTTSADVLASITWREY